MLRVLHAKSCLASRGPSTGQSARWIIGENRADHEGRSASTDHRQRNPVDLTVKGKTDQLDGVGERIELAYIVEHGTALPNPPEWIKRRRSEEHRKDHEVHHTGEIFQLLDTGRNQHAERAEHQP